MSHIIQSLGVVTTDPPASDFAPPYFDVNPAVALITHEAVAVSATGNDDFSPSVTYQLVAYPPLVGPPTDVTAKTGTAADGTTPIDILQTRAGLPAGAAITLNAAELTPETDYFLAVVLFDGVFCTIYDVGQVTTLIAPLTRADLRDTGECLHPDWLPFILPFAEGVPEQFVFQQLGETLEEFCDKTRLWRDTLTPIDVMEGVEVYEAELPQGVQIVQAESVYLDGLALHPTTEAEFQSLTTRRGYIRQDARFALLPAPNKDIPGGLSLVCSFKPTWEADQCPRFIFNDWRQVIVDGVLMRLLRMTKQNWGDLDEATVRMSTYQKGLSRGSATRNQLDDGTPFRATGPRVIRNGRILDHRTF